jgi:RecB family exonuclease
MHPLTAWLLEHLPAPEDRARAFVVAPSAQAAASQRAAVLAERPALLGVHFATATAFARACATWLGEPPPSDPMLPLEQRALLLDAADAVGGEVATYARAHAGAAVQLLATCREWLAQLGPEPTAPLSPWGAATLRIARLYGEALLRHPRSSRTKVMAMAAAAAGRRTAARRARILLCGYRSPEADLLALLTALEAGGACDVRASPRFTSRCPAVRASHPNLLAEARGAAHRCALAFRRGRPWREMVVAAPRLEPYVPLLGAAFNAEGVPIEARAEAPLAREPRAALALHAARLVFDRAGRESFAALVGSPLLRRPLPAREVRIFEERALLVGLEGRGPAAQRFASSLAADAPAAAALLGRLLGAAAAAEHARTAAQQSDVLAALLDAELAPPADGSRDAQCAERLAACLEEATFAPTARYFAELAALLGQRGLPLGSGGEGAVQVVEYRDALAFPAGELHVLGLTSSQVPEPPPNETFFSAADRGCLPRMMHRGRDKEEQRARLEELAALPTRALTLSRSRTDAGGFPAPPALWLDALAAGAAATGELHERAHPLEQAQVRVASGVCARDFAVAMLALRGATPAAAARALSSSAGALLQRVRCLEDFGGTLERDGFVGEDAVPAGESVSATALEVLGGCPQRYLFTRLCRVAGLPPAPDPLIAPGNVIGAKVHEVMALIAARLRDAADVAAAGAEAMASARALLEERLADAMPLAHSVPGLFDLLLDRWAAAVARSVRADLDTLLGDGSRPEDAEVMLDGELDLEGGARLRVHGKLDRLDRLPGGGSRIIDYKTGRRPLDVLDPTRILRGRQLQLPIYAMLVHAREGRRPEAVEVRPVHPDAAAPPALPWAHAGRLEQGEFGQGVRETLAVLTAVRQSGAFVPSFLPEVCRFCELRPACRRHHPPSRERVTQATAPALARYRALARKHKNEPLLAATVGHDDG